MEAGEEVSRAEPRAVDTAAGRVGVNGGGRGRWSERLKGLDGVGPEWSREVGNLHRQSAEHFWSVLVSCSWPVVGSIHVMRCILYDYSQRGGCGLYEYEHS